MCGIAGIYSPKPAARSLPAEDTVEEMTETLTHRGPDDEGVWVSPGRHCVLGHKRLSILDLTQTGSQPMTTKSGRWTLSYNGEVYNFPSLRTTLEEQGHEFRGTSDTEVLLNGIEQWGMPEALGQVNGMFAFGAWDEKKQRLLLARDRLGQKPLYYAELGDSVVFASEVRAIQQHPDFQGRLNPAAVQTFLRRGYIPSPLSIYESVNKLPPGTWIEFRGRGALGPYAYWDLPSPSGDTFRGHSSDVNGEVSVGRRIEEAIEKRMAADVPVGAFFSGGLDSTLIVSVMQEIADDPVSTFTIGFDDPRYNEAREAERLAEYIGTNHSQRILRPDDAMDVVPELVRIYDEPFADSSQIPTVLLSRLAREEVKVVLSGDGGDEFFGGYDRYLDAARLWDRMGYLPYLARSWIGGRMESLWDSHGNRFLPQGTRKFAALIRAGSIEEFHETLLSNWTPGPFREAKDVPTLRSGNGASEFSTPEALMRLDVKDYLPGDLLTKVDRASMSVGLEVRSPLLDHRVVEGAFRLPLSAKMGQDSRKKLVRSLLEERIPKELWDRQKSGFSVPLDRWLRGPLATWSEERLGRLQDRGITWIDEQGISKRWEEHLEEGRDWGRSLWNAVMLEAWLEEHQPGAGT